MLDFTPALNVGERRVIIGAKVAEEDPWGWSKMYSYRVLHPGYLLTEYNGNPAAKNVMTEAGAPYWSRPDLGIEPENVEM